MALKEYTSFSLDMLKRYHGKIRDWVKSVLPTKTSELENDSGYITADDVPSQAVYHDETMTGTGEESTPLSVKEMAGAVSTLKSIKVGSKEYGVVKIGNLYWMTENLTELGGLNPSAIKTKKFDSVDINTWYYRKNIIFKSYAAGDYTDEFRALLPDGWRIPTIADYNSLKTAANNDPKNCFVAADGGNNSLGLNGFITEQYYSSSWPSGNELNRMIMMLDNASSMYNLANTNVQHNWMGVSGHYDNYWQPIRLVCDVVPESDGTKGLVPQPKIADHDNFLKGDGTWGKPADPVFKATYNVTPFADIRAAIDAGRSVVCDVSGYEYCLAKDDNTSVTFSSTYKDNSGNITHDYAVVTADGWDAEAIRLAKATDVPTATSQLVNDSNFVKVVVSTEPPAEGTPDDVLTAILDGEPQPVVKSDTITRIERVTEVPAEPEEGVLYIVVEGA